MLRLRKFAITGGVASGKSTVCSFFKELGAYVVSADEIVHNLLTYHADLSKKLIQVLGSEIVQNNKIDRSKVGQKVFKDPQKLSWLESILHPLVFEEIEKQYQKACKTTNHTFFIVEMPLLFETETQNNYDAVIAVIADDTLAQRRFALSGHTAQEYEERMKRQISPSEKKAKAHFIIHNNSSLADLQRQVEQLNTILRSYNHP